jgi:hypothetical protein
MPLHDSILRETLRLNPSFDDSMLREVVAPAGIHTPQGVYLPCGSQDWGEFRPFRYCEMAAAAAEAAESFGGDEDEGRMAVPAGKGQISAVQISERYMLFGLGKHAW